MAALQFHLIHLIGADASLEASVGCYCLAFANRVWNDFVIIVFVAYTPFTCIRAC
jgi:hypothetical protein